MENTDKQKSNDERKLQRMKDIAAKTNGYMVIEAVVFAVIVFIILVAVERLVTGKIEINSNAIVTVIASIGVTLFNIRDRSVARKKLGEAKHED